MVLRGMEVFGLLLVKELILLRIQVTVLLGLVLQENLFLTIRVMM